MEDGVRWGAGSIGGSGTRAGSGSIDMDLRVYSIFVEGLQPDET